jgi:hypothetical protein
MTVSQRDREILTNVIFTAPPIVIVELHHGHTVHQHYPPDTNTAANQVLFIVDARRSHIGFVLYQPNQDRSDYLRTARKYSTLSLAIDEADAHLLDQSLPTEQDHSLNGLSVEDYLYGLSLHPSISAIRRLQAIGLNRQQCNKLTPMGLRHESLITEFGLPKDAPHVCDMDTIVTKHAAGALSLTGVCGTIFGVDSPQHHQGHSFMTPPRKIDLQTHKNLFFCLHCQGHEINPDPTSDALTETACDYCTRNTNSYIPLVAHSIIQHHPNNTHPHRESQPPGNRLSIANDARQQFLIFDEDHV